MNAALCLDEEITEMMSNFDPHYNVVDFDYFKVNKNLYLPPTTVANLSNFASKDKDKSSACDVKERLEKMYNKDR